MGRWNIRALDLKDADACATVCLRLRRYPAVAKRRLPPPAFDHSLGTDGVLVETPLAGAPAKNLIGRPREVSGHPILIPRPVRREV